MEGGQPRRRPRDARDAGLAAAEALGRSSVLVEPDAARVEVILSMAEALTGYSQAPICPVNHAVTA